MTGDPDLESKTLPDSQLPTIHSERRCVAIPLFFIRDKFKKFV
jgi:hypothetical protein